mmetsp:Transcript_25762/g.79463  ORF Transcript_25762/g.79463 Transcript_25762/m.79463 type:complete len:336 (-) Transcript_25762:224-1231(-)
MCRGPPVHKGTARGGASRTGFFKVGRKHENKKARCKSEAVDRWGGGREAQAHRAHTCGVAAVARSRGDGPFGRGAPDEVAHRHRGAEDALHGPHLARRDGVWLVGVALHEPPRRLPRRVVVRGLLAGRADVGNREVRRRVRGVPRGGRGVPARTLARGPRRARRCGGRRGGGVAALWRGVLRLMPRDRDNRSGLFRLRGVVVGARRPPRPLSRSRLRLRSLRFARSSLGGLGLLLLRGGALRRVPGFVGALVFGGGFHLVPLAAVIILGLRGRRAPHWKSRSRSRRSVGLQAFGRWFGNREVLPLEKRLRSACRVWREENPEVVWGEERVAVSRA